MASTSRHLIGRGRRPHALDRVGFVFAGPRRHGNGNCSERLVAQGAELEVGTQRNGQADARLDYHDFLAVVLPPPHLARDRRGKNQISSTVRWATALDVWAGLEFKMRHAAALQAQ